MDQNLNLSTDQIINIGNNFMLQPPSANFYRVARSSFFSFSLFYTRNIQCQVFLEISIIPKSDESNTVQNCTKHGPVWFSCNQTNVNFGESYIVPMVLNRFEKNLCFQFHCTNQCSSMYENTLIRFCVRDEQNTYFYKRDIPFKVSERPRRDERNSPFATDNL